MYVCIQIEHSIETQVDRCRHAWPWVTDNVFQLPQLMRVLTAKFACRSTCCLHQPCHLSPLCQECCLQWFNQECVVCFGCFGCTAFTTGSLTHVLFDWVTGWCSLRAVHGSGESQELRGVEATIGIERNMPSMFHGVSSCQGAFIPVLCNQIQHPEKRWGSRYSEHRRTQLESGLLHARRLACLCFNMFQLFTLLLVCERSIL